MRLQNSLLIDDIIFLPCFPFPRLVVFRLQFNCLLASVRSTRLTEFGFVFLRQRFGWSFRWCKWNSVEKEMSHGYRTWTKTKTGGFLPKKSIPEPLRSYENKQRTWTAAKCFEGRHGLFLLQSFGIDIKMESHAWLNEACMIGEDKLEMFPTKKPAAFSLEKL